MEILTFATNIPTRLVNLISDVNLLSFALIQKKVTKKKSRLYENFLFSTGQTNHAIQAAPALMPTLASVSLTKGHRFGLFLENLRNFYKVDSQYLCVLMPTYV